MCGRYQFTAEESREIMDIVREVERNLNTPVHTGEIFPTNEVPILTGADHEIKPELMAWGFPHFKGSGVIINARAETSPEKKMFATCLDSRRCVIPTTGFYEWNKDKVKYKFNLPQVPELYMAGLYNDFAGERRFVVLTTAANSSVQAVHHRMPVVLTRDMIYSWVNNLNATNNILLAVPPMLSSKIV